MKQSEMDFGIYTMTDANHMRSRNAPLLPDVDGLFDVDGVVTICRRRHCHFEPVSALFGNVTFIENIVRLDALAPGRWDPVAVLAACTKVNGNKVYGVDYDGAYTRNPANLNELRIAAVVGADGTQPYVSKRASPHRCDPTWAFRKLLDGLGVDGRHRYSGDYRIRRALRALEDAGLIHIELGARGGMTTAKFIWTARAYLAPERLAPSDEAAMDILT